MRFRDKKNNIFCFFVLLVSIICNEASSQGLAELFTRICYENCKNTDSYISYAYLDKLEDRGQFPVKDQSVSVFSLDLNLFDSNFGIHVSDYIANDSGYVKLETVHIAPYYSNVIFPGTKYQCYYKVMVKQRHFYRNEEFSPQDTYEYIFLSSLPTIFGNDVGWNLDIRYDTPAHGGDSYFNRDYSGWYFKTGVDYKLSLPPVYEMPTKLRLFWNIAYRDNLGGSQYDSDWSHTTWGVSTDIDITENISINPTLRYQKTMDEMVAEKDTLYATVFFRYRF